MSVDNRRREITTPLPSRLNSLSNKVQLLTASLRGNLREIMDRMDTFLSMHRLKNSYEQAVNALRVFDISFERSTAREDYNKGARSGFSSLDQLHGLLLYAPEVLLPSWENLEIDSNVLEKARQFKKPVIILVPPATCSMLLKAINAHISPNSFKTPIANENETPKGNWEAYIVEGLPDSGKNYQSNGDEKKLNGHEQVVALLEEYHKQGLGVLNDPRAFLMQFMQRVASGEYRDSHSCKVVLNPEAVARKNTQLCYPLVYEDSTVSFAYLDSDIPVRTIVLIPAVKLKIRREK